MPSSLRTKKDPCTASRKASVMGAGPGKKLDTPGLSDARVHCLARATARSCHRTDILVTGWDQLCCPQEEAALTLARCAYVAGGL